MTLETTIRLVRLVAWARVGKHYFIPVGGHSPLGGLGYVRAALEIDEQTRSLGIEAGWLVAAAGSGGTLAGLMAGLALVDSPLRLLGIDVGRLWKAFPASIARLASELCSQLGCPRSFSPNHVPLIEGRYVGPGYARSMPECADAIRCLARAEGLLLDPVYTGKAFAGLLDLVRNNLLGGNEPVIFLHTGGAPALFA
jgi:D-cysteine desulfhydrase